MPDTYPDPDSNQYSNRHAGQHRHEHSHEHSNGDCYSGLNSDIDQYAYDDKHLYPYNHAKR